jgi:hypothetical protein
MKVHEQYPITFKHDYHTHEQYIVFISIHAAIDQLYFEKCTGTLFSNKGCEIRVRNGAANLADLAICYSIELS